jgi:hypothetical protein
MEAALAVQMACTHAVALAVLSRAGGGHGGDRHVAIMAAASAWLLRAFATQVEAMRRLRNGSTQVIRVERIEVSDTAQAIIGNVRTPSTQATRVDNCSSGLNDPSSMSARTAPAAAPRVAVGRWLIESIQTLAPVSRLKNSCSLLNCCAFKVTFLTSCRSTRKMRLEIIARDSLRQRIVLRYSGALQSSPLVVIDYLLGHVLIASRHLPLSARYVVGESLRDIADVLERQRGCAE